MSTSVTRRRSLPAIFNRSYQRASTSIALLVLVTGLLTVPQMATAQDDSTLQPVRISLAPDGGDTSGGSFAGSASADGQWAVFISDAPEYGSTAGKRVPVLADVAARSTQVLGSDGTDSVSISPDGSTIAIVERPAGDAYHRLRIVDRITRSSAILNHPDGSFVQIGHSSDTYFSADARFLLFKNTDYRDVDESQVALLDRHTGQYRLVSRNNQGDLAQDDAYPWKLSPDGRYAYFDSDSPNLPDADSSRSSFRLFKRDTLTNTTAEITEAGNIFNFGLSDNGRFGVTAFAGGPFIAVTDYSSGETTSVPLPDGVYPSSCPRAGTKIDVSNDGQRFFILTCQDDPHDSGVLWHFDRTTGQALRIAGPRVGIFGGAPPFGDLAGIVFDAEDGAVPSDINGYSEVYIARASEPPVPSNTLVAFGDSIAAGEGSGPSSGYPNNEGAYPSKLANQLGWTAQNFAISGACSTSQSTGSSGTPTSCTKSILDDQLPLAKSHNLDPDLITITIGANDIQFGKCFESVIGLGVDNPCKKAKLKQSLNALALNLTRTLAAIRDAYPDAPIALTRYFNPLPGPGETCTLMPGLYLYKTAVLDKDWRQAAKTVASGNLESASREFQEKIAGEALSVIGELNSVLQEVGDSQGATTVPLDFTGHDLCKDYADSGAAGWVFGPVADVFVSGYNRSVGNSHEWILEPSHRCKPTPECDTVSITEFKSYEWARMKFSYSIVFRSNDLPHLTSDGHAAVANFIKKRLSP